MDRSTLLYCRVLPEGLLVQDAVLSVRDKVLLIRDAVWVGISARSIVGKGVM
jgi:hypothetical protein